MVIHRRHRLTTWKRGVHDPSESNDNWRKCSPKGCMTVQFLELPVDWDSFMT